MFIFACVFTFILLSALILLLRVLRNIIVELNRLKVVHNDARSIYDRRKRL